MARAEIFWGDTAVKVNRKPVAGDIVTIDGEPYYKVSNYDRMRPFLMSIVSSADHWMYVSSTGGLTCGRRDPDNALFPYETDDKLHDSITHTGPQSVLLVNRGGKNFLWKPFSNGVAVYSIQRNLFKSLVGDQVIFEEINTDLGLAFSYRWSSSKRFGFVKSTKLRNTAGERVVADVLDGIRNLLPPGVNRDLQSRKSTLVDAYRKAEIDKETGVGIYSLTSIPTDRAEARESLRASIAWCQGFNDPKILLSENQSADFCAGKLVQDETTLNGQRGAFFAQSRFDLPAGESARWYHLADIGLGPTGLPDILEQIKQGVTAEEIEADIQEGTQNLVKLVGGADGCQCNADERASGRHFANTLFNISRGGTFTGEYRIKHQDLLDFAASWNAPLQTAFSDLLASQPEPVERNVLISAAESTGDAHIQRLVLEYLPLSFSRRHGDPSRPWNEFSIDLRNEDGTEKLNFQGNWRDIFQNWEALSISFPEYINSFITKFVNATTMDGYNAYRISRDGIEWEELDPEDPWSNIGYWGDHQANYLSSLLELSLRYYPDQVSKLLERELFVFADVPYRIKAYPALLANPRDSIEFDQAHARRVSQRVSRIGADGKLLTLDDGSIYRVNLLEKLLLVTLSKLGSFIPGGGIWMNTQRPEWNDANNALAGFGLSMVTLCYLRRLLGSFKTLVQVGTSDTFLVSAEVKQFFSDVVGLLCETRSTVEQTLESEGRKQFMDRLGTHASDYRALVYAGPSGEKSALQRQALLEYIETALFHLDHSLEQGRRPDGLFDSYNVIRFEASSVEIESLPEMLEGQVAFLTSGFLDTKECLALLDVLRYSKLYCRDRQSYLLYPARELPSFLERNLIPESEITSNNWLQDELASGKGVLVQQDVSGAAHFNGSIGNVDDLMCAIERHGGINADETGSWIVLFETVFNHRESMGRSGFMYKYEGIDCIYWHMVSKLLLAVACLLEKARQEECGRPLLDGLAEHFDDIRNGLGLHKTPADYGAIPLDPYSHTPGFTGPQQPGMTGQVKEDFITRFKELGVNIRNGVVLFEPWLLRRDHFLTGAQSWVYPKAGKLVSEDLEAGSIGFTLCGTPVIYRFGNGSSIEVYDEAENVVEVIPALNLGEARSRALFSRDPGVGKLRVCFPAESLR